jgi:alkylation response protein AidB-like acyl-CoA dehydrogenase
MNVNETPEQAAFRAEVRDWIANRVPPHLKGLRQSIVQGPGLGHEELRPLVAALAEKGWAAPHWPREFGGAGFDIPQLVIFSEECAKAGVPDRHTTGLDMLGPILMKYGTPAQQQAFLPRILADDMVWAQGYSEPEAGSDLANLQLRATVQEDGSFVVTGQKIWTSKAHKADWVFLLCRTDPKPKRKQEGISFILCEMTTPGITVRPIVTMDNFTHFTEVFFDEVRVPAANLVGQLHKGWEVAKALLGHERFLHPTSNPLLIRNAINNVKSLARELPAGNGVAWDNPELRRRVAALEMDCDGLLHTRYRSLTKIEHGQAPGPETMMFKLFGAELMQRIVELHQEVAACDGVVWDDTEQGSGPGETARHAANIRAATIRGGTSEVQRNIIAKRVLGLPD